MAGAKSRLVPCYLEINDAPKEFQSLRSTLYVCVGKGPQPQARGLLPRLWGKRPGLV